MFEVAEAYEVMMGRWSREFVGVRDARRCSTSDAARVRYQRLWAALRERRRFVGIDPSDGFIEYARKRPSSAASVRFGTFAVHETQNQPEP
jgi:hypothetical protein